MNNTDYQKKVAAWNVKRRNIIVDTLALLQDEDTELYEKLLPVLDQKPIEKPAHHIGGRETDFFEVPLSEFEFQEIIDKLFNLEAYAVPTNEILSFEEEALRSREASRIARLVDEWNKLNTG
ncbi:hypothetical protein ACFL48_02685 [Pseudomonadota bacterium]